MVTTMFPVPLGFVRYQNSASLLENVDTLFANGTPPNVTETALLLFASTLTTSRRLVPVPALTPESVSWYGEADTVPDVDLTLFSMIANEPPVVALVVADAVLEVDPVPTELIADTLYVYAVLAASPVLEYVVDVDAVFATVVDQVVPLLVERSILYPVIAEPPLLDGAVQERLICDDEDAVAVSPVGEFGAVGEVPVLDAFTSIAASSQRSPLPLAVQPHVTGPADDFTDELDAPVIAPAMLVFHCCVQVGDPRVTPP